MVPINLDAKGTLVVARMVRRARRRRSAIRQTRFISRRVLRLELLESRCLLAPVFWDGEGDGSRWGDPLNWSGNALPGATDDVTINFGSGTVQHEQFGGTSTVNSLTTTNPFTLLSGTLSIVTTLQVNNIFTLDGGTLSGGAVSFATGQTLTATSRGSTLTGVTVNGDVTLAANFASVTIAGGTTFASAHLSGNDSSIEFAPGQILTGNILFEGPNPGERLVGIDGTAGTLTIGPNGSIKTASGFDGVGYVGKFNDSPSASVMTLVNQGLIEANSGTLLLVGATSWSNSGTIRVLGGSLNLRGTLTTAALNPASFVRTGGTVNLQGMLNNANDTLTLNNNTGTWVLSGGTVSGGTLNFADGQTLGMNSQPQNRLTGVTVNGDLTLSVDFARVRIEGGTTFANAHLGGTQTSLGFAPGQILTGNVLFKGAGSYVEMNGTAGTLTIGPTGSIKTVAGASGIIGGSGPFGGAMTLVNEGLISAEANFNTLIVGPSNLTNTGTIRVNAGSTLNLAGSPSWSNTGTINVAGGTLNILNTLTTAALNQPGFVRTDGTVNIKGTLDNSGSTLALADNVIVEGTIVGGTISTLGTAKLLLAGTLTGVKLAGVAEVNGAFVKGGLTLDGGQLIVLASRSLTFQGSNQALTGNGTVLFAGTGGSLQVEANRQLTIGPDVIVVASTGTNRLTASASGASGVIDATISTPAGATVLLVGNWTDRSTRIVPTSSPGGGQLSTSVLNVGNISVSGEQDNWTYFAQGGEALSLVLFPASGINPALGFAQLQILDPTNNVIAAAAGATHGQSVQLVGFTFPADGTYTIRIQASPAQSSAVGNYLLRASTTTADTRPLVLNQPVTGVVEDASNTDRWTFSAIANQQVQFDLIAATSAAIRFRLTGPNGFVGFTDLAADSGLVNLPTTGEYVLHAAGNVAAAETYTMRLVATSQTPLTLGNAYSGSLPGSGFVQLFKVDVAQSSPLLIEFDGATNTDRTEVYARLASPPTRQTFDARFEANGADHQLAIPLAAPGAWYVLVYGDHVPTPSNFTLLAKAPLISTLGISPKYGGVREKLQHTITGLGFVPGTQFHLVPVGGGAAVTSERVTIDSTTQAAATFDLTSAAIGDYDLRATLPTGQSHNLAAGFKVGALAGSNFETRLILPAQLGRHEAATLHVEYENTGLVPMAAPILIVQSGDPDNSDRPLLTLDQSRVTGGFWTSAIPDGFANAVQIDASGAAPGVLQPGEQIRVPVYYVGLQAPWDISDTGVELELRIHEAGDTTIIDWPSLESELRPEWIAADAWPAVFANLQSQIGVTWGDYTRTLGNNSQYLKRLGENVKSIEDLYAFEVQQAVGIDPLGAIAAAVDADAASPGLPLTFARSFGNTITERYRVGPLGRGWNTSWQQSAEVLVDGTVIVHESADSQRRFQPDSRRANSYFSQTGDTGTLRKVTGGAFELTETNGLVTRFLPDGRLDVVRDTYGNSITAGYTNNRLTGLTHSSGKALAIAYNPAGRVASITDPFGRTTTFGYDPTDTLLLTATNAIGTTIYTYSTGSGAARQYALTSVTDPSGVKQSFEYDSRGRLTATFYGANLDRTTYAYGETGTVTITDAANAFITLSFNQNRQVARVEDNTGFYVRTQYDASLRPIAQTDPQGATQTTTWTITGAVRTLTDELGHITTFTSGGPLNQPTSFSDARGNLTRYAYNPAGGLTATTYADDTVERATYDLQGNPDLLTNRRGQTIDRTVNAAGQMTREARSDGTAVDYTYDASGRLHTATDASGVTTLSYDAADRLTRVEYPNGRWLQYAYDAAGRRTRLEDHTGFVVKYVFDAAGRLERLLDATDALIVRYTFDSAGRLSREDKGNGTFTVYGYDLAGRIASITHRAPDNSINASFSYAYDLSGRRVGATTPDGAWTYSYDLTDQLIRAVFASTNAAIQNQDLSYEYDALGNRVRTILNGATTNYTANSLNQYTAAGATTFAYDLDGNLTQETGLGGTKTYTYDLQNWLKSVQTPQGLWQYEYDVLGNRSAVIVNGQRTEYLIDPTGLGEVIGEYNGAGTRLSGYAHGRGLEGVSSTAGWGYYDYDAIGSTAGISAAPGAYVNRYAYEPFGTTLLSNEGRANPFEFVGEFGVMAEGNGLNFMRARYYHPDEGRFANQDPIRLAGRDFNLYRYVSNNPVNRIDPSGLEEEPTKIDAETCLELNGLIAAPADRDPNKPNYCVLNEPPPVCEELGGIAATSGNCAFPCVGDGCNPPPAPPPPTPPTPPCDPGDKSCNGEPPVPQSKDPNEKLGASGHGPQGYILPATLIPYRINFENLGPGSVPPPAQPATAPAQRVEVTDQLSTHLDWSTLEFSEFGFGDTRVTVPAGRANHFETVLLTYNNRTFDVQVELDFDFATGQINAVFQTLDPGTSLPPDVLTGFLPPEDGTGIGKAFFAYTVQPKANLASGTELRNIALIRFDGQTSIATNQVDPQDPSKGIDLAKEALNTIDAAGPNSSITALPALQNATFTVHWTGADDASGAGVAAYSVFVSDNGGPYTIFQTDTAATSASFTGQPGHTYRFYSIATDNVGHVEPVPAFADALTEVSSQLWHNVINALDVIGPEGAVDGIVLPFDALAVINYINAFGIGKVPTDAISGPPYYDTTGDGSVLPGDALAVINFLNAFGFGLPGPEGDGESSPVHSATDLWPATQRPDVILAKASEAAVNQSPIVYVRSASKRAPRRLIDQEDTSQDALARKFRLPLEKSTLEAVDHFFSELAPQAKHL